MKDDLVSIEGLSPAQLIKIGEAGIKTRDDLADLAADELVEMLGAGQITEKDANVVIMNARAHWFADEQQAATQTEEQPA
jgi:N utilization substance protein A